MKDNLPDPDKVFREVASVTKLCLSLRKARLEAEKDVLLERFESFLNNPDKMPNPDPDAMSVGFQNCWLKKDYKTIVKAGAFMSEHYLYDNPKLHAYVMFAKREMDKQPD